LFSFWTLTYVVLERILNESVLLRTIIYK